MKHDLWSAKPKAAPQAEPDADHVFANFRNSRSTKGMTEAEARQRARRRGEDSMRGVVVEVRRSRQARQDFDAVTLPRP